MWHTHNSILHSNKENEILPFVITWMDLECVMLSEISQAEKGKYCIVSLICEIQRKQNK